MVGSHNTPPEDWNVPEKGQSGSVGLPDKIASKFKGSKGIWMARSSEPREEKLMGILEATCKEMGIDKPPRLFIYYNKKPSVMSNLASKSIGFSTNLIDIMPQDQMKAIMAHTLTHYKYRTRDRITHWSIEGTTAVVTGILFAQEILGSHHAESALNILKLEGEVDLAEIGIVAAESAIKYRGEYEADKGGAEVVGKKTMIKALNTIEARKQEIDRTREEIGDRTIKVPSILTYPKTEKRVTRLEKLEAPDGPDTRSR